MEDIQCGVESCQYWNRKNCRCLLPIRYVLRVEHNPFSGRNEVYCAGYKEKEKDQSPTEVEKRKKEDGW